MRVLFGDVSGDFLVWGYELFSLFSRKERERGRGSLVACVLQVSVPLALWVFPELEAREREKRRSKR
ncbi:hypothetical protein KFK09_021826 [Dendrobium nobile]|uniref:Uncharacterized protein n=1 Tax=Dendrobium nobile TaxID=94219 RepID=A0A8T3AMT8_DENNO|nr:hypothetical protein KFK09_021826 [Dendrobium nobile]